MTTGSVKKKLFQLSLPMVWGIFSILAFNLADTFFIAKLGSDELTAISFTFPVVFVIGSISLGLGIGASSVISREIGAQDLHQVRKVTFHAITLGIVIGLIFVVVGVLNIDRIFSWLGARGKVLDLINDYMQIWFIGIIFLVVPMIGNSIIRATGDTKIPSLIMMIAAGVNIVIDPFFIFGWGGFPKLGIKGAAVATVIARAITLVASLWILIYREKLLTISTEMFRGYIQSTQKILRVGLPAAGSNLVVPITTTIITAILATLDEYAVAAFGVVSRIESFMLVVLMALSSVIVPFVGQNFGAGKHDRIREAIRVSFWFSLFWGVFVTVLLLSTGEFLVSQFSSDEKILQYAVWFFILVPFTYGLEGIRLISGSTCNALDRPMPPTWIMVLKMFLIYIPGSMILSVMFGVKGVFAAAGLSNFFGGLISWVYIKRVILPSLWSKNLSDGGSS